MRYLQFSIAIILFFFASCSKPEVEVPTLLEKKKLIDIYMEMTDPELDASVSLTNYQANFGQTTDDIVNYMSTVCLSDKGICSYDNLYIDTEEFTFGQGRQLFQDEYDFSNFFGKELTFRFSDGIEGKNFQTANLYLPQALSVTLQDNTFLGTGHPINWNADLQNDQGVFIVVIYNTLENPNMSALYPDKQTNYIELIDDGNYVFNPSDFPDIPEGSIVTLKILRGAYIIAQDEAFQSQLTRVFGMTHSTGYIKFN